MDTTVPGAAANALLLALGDGQPHTMQALTEALGLNVRQVSDAAAKLRHRKLVQRPTVGTYQLNDAGLVALSSGLTITSGPTGPTGARHIIRDTFRQRAWSAMRVRRVFTIGEIVSDAGRGEAHRERDNARRYLTALKTAGYVALEPRRRPGTALTSNGFKAFRLLRNTGPCAPVFSEARRTLYDPNTEEDVPCNPV